MRRNNSIERFRSRNGAHAIAPHYHVTTHIRVLFDESYAWRIIMFDHHRIMNKYLSKPVTWTGVCRNFEAALTMRACI